MSNPSATSGEGSAFGADEVVFHLELTAAQMKLTHTALRALLDDFGHEEHKVREIVKSVLDKLPDEHSIRAIDVGRGQA